jgi:hypothetical protein
MICRLQVRPVMTQALHKLAMSITSLQPQMTLTFTVLTLRVKLLV